FNALWNAALDRGGERNGKYVEVRGGKRWLPEAPASLRFHRHLLDLTGSEEEILGRFEGSVRQAIRKAEKSGVKAEKNDSLDGMRTYYRLHCGTRKKHGLRPQ